MSTVTTGVRAYGHLINGQEVRVDEATIERCSPATGELVARLITGRPRENDSLILAGFSPYRKAGGEALK